MTFLPCWIEDRLRSSLSTALSVFGGGLSMLCAAEARHANKVEKVLVIRRGDCA